MGGRGGKTGRGMGREVGRGGKGDRGLGGKGKVDVCIQLSTRDQRRAVLWFISSAL
jgi:hypothetical protein